MNNKKYVKTYKPLIAWLIGFLPISMIISKRFDTLSLKISVLLLLMFTVISIYFLMFIIYKGEYVYWINGGPNFEESKAASSEKRKEYAKAHLDIFFKMVLISFSYAIMSLLFKFPVWIDILTISLSITIAALSTIPIKFDN